MIDQTTPLFDCNSCLFRLLTCQYISPDEFKPIREASIQLHFKKGETIFKQGTKSTHLVFLHKGIVKFIDEVDCNLFYIFVLSTKLWMSSRKTCFIYEKKDIFKPKGKKNHKSKCFNKTIEKDSSLSNVG